jgi:glycosyltransferase involved in cell wall biosynthesis
MTDRKLTVATSFPVWPPRGGGQQRVVGLYRGLAREGVAVDVVALADHRTRPAVREIAPGMREIRVPKSADHDRAELALHLELGIPVTDVALHLFGDMTPAYGDALSASAADATAIAACHPFGFPALRAAAPDLPLIYEAQDVETDIKAEMLEGDDSEAARSTVAAVREVEAATCADAALVATCSEFDRERLGELFGVPAARSVAVANGTECADIPFVSPDARTAYRAALGMEAFTVLFVGSWHGPNVEAAHAILDAARVLTDATFVVVGSVGRALEGEDSPPNVDLTGAVDDGFLRGVLAVADVAVNPMVSGSGTNLKMLEYAAAGLPLVSSAFGTRGLGFVAGEHYAPGEPAELAAALAAVRAEPAHETARRVRVAYERVSSTFDWPVIARDWLAHEEMRRILSLQPCP